MRNCRTHITRANSKALVSKSINLIAVDLIPEAPIWKEVKDSPMAIDVMAEFFYEISRLENWYLSNKMIMGTLFTVINSTVITWFVDKTIFNGTFPVEGIVAGMQVFMSTNEDFASQVVEFSGLLAESFTMDMILNILEDVEIETM